MSLDTRDIVSSNDRIARDDRHTWRVEPGPLNSEMVTVRFEARGAHTEVVVVHERIRDERPRDEHQNGWEGCLDGLVRLTGQPDLR